LSAKRSQPKGRTIAATVIQKVLRFQNLLSLGLSMPAYTATAVPVQTGV
jgi:hypothetical protein